MDEKQRNSTFSRIFADYVNVQEKEVREAVEKYGIVKVLAQPEEIFDGLSTEHRNLIQDLHYIFSGEFLTQEINEKSEV
ncbi:MAG: hypothetical protein WBH77_08190 [Saccharofermentanales bacterium]